MLKRFALLIVLLSLSLAGRPALAQEAQTPTDLCAAAQPAAEPETREFSNEPPRVIETGVDYRAILCTGAGAVYVDLFEDYSPLATNSFVFLASTGYYNNTTFHRVLENFMAQGGDPTGTGTGGPGYQFSDEVLSYLTFETDGILAMANAGPNTNGSQFFITTVPTPHLNYGYSIFGYVLEGQEHVLDIQLRDPDTATEPGTSLDTVIIITDPAQVVSSAQVPAASSTTSEELQAAFETIIPDLPEGLIVDSTDSGVRSTEDTIAAAPESEREAYTNFLSSYGHAYRVGQALETTICDLDALPFMAISAQVDAFSDSEAAQAALADGYLDTLAAARGFTVSEDRPASLANTLYTLAGNVCEVPSLQALTYAQRGRYIITYEAIVPQSGEIRPDQWLSAFVSRQVYDSLLGDILVRELPWAPSAQPPQ